jgi:hypothetical protein
MATRETLAVLLLAAVVSGCGSVKEKTAPCRRPSTMTSYADDGVVCGSPRPVNDPAAVFRAIGITDPAEPRDGADE